EEPSSKQSEYEQKHQCDGRGRSESAQDEGAVPGHHGTRSADHTVGDVAHEELERLPRLAGEPCRGEHQDTCEHEETGVAEGEFEANAQTWSSTHGLLPRCGIRRRPRWR